MVIDVLFLIAGIVLVVWGVIGVMSPDLSWRINGRIGIRPETIGDERLPEWAQLSRRYGLWGIVIGAFNIFFAALRLF